MGGGVHSRPMTIADMAAAAHDEFTDRIRGQDERRQMVADIMRDAPTAEANLRFRLEQGRIEDARIAREANELRRAALQSFQNERDIAARAADVFDPSPPQIAQLAGGAAGAVQNAIPIDDIDENISAMMGGMMSENIPEAIVRGVGQRGRNLLRQAGQLDEQLRGYQVGGRGRLVPNSGRGGRGGR